MRTLRSAVGLVALAMTITACSGHHADAAYSVTSPRSATPGAALTSATANSPTPRDVSGSPAVPTATANPVAPTQTPPTTTAAAKPRPPAAKPALTLTANPAPTTPKPPAKPLPLLVEQLASVNGAHQVVIVTASNFSTDVATVQTFEYAAGSWHAVFPAMAAHIGRAGFSSDKHEGDLKTPTGIYGFGTMFGQRANPGVKFPYRQADSASVWVDDVNSPYYNTWQENAALSGEHLASSGYATAYAYAVDIAYNTTPVVAGKGSAIFLHVSTGGGTAGCVSIAQSNLLQVLRWLDPAMHPVIVMGPTSTVRQY